MTPEKGLFFKKIARRDIELFSDEDWAGLLTNRRPTFGYCIFVWGNLVTWKSKKQVMVSRNSVEVEYKAVSQGICEGIWLKRLLRELKIPFEKPMKMYYDN